VKIDFQYAGPSRVSSSSSGMSISFSPNLARPKVFYDAELRDPLRFREAICALHDVVVGDLKYKIKSKSAYIDWKKQEAENKKQRYREAYRQSYQASRERIERERKEFSEGFQKTFLEARARYWRARNQWLSELSRKDPQMFRQLVPCDPVVTVAPDVVFFECFSKDESSYGCLSVDRDLFRGESGSGQGTTNVDYSLSLYEHFESLRSYRPTRLVVDPTGFEVKVESVADYKEEKIDLPSSWLRGFSQLQAAMSLPSTHVSLTVEALYSVLAYLKNHREKVGPRSIRFLLTPGKPAMLVLDPWGVQIQTYGPVYQGDTPQEIKVWGRRRLETLSRLLPLIERVEVRLLGSGLPSIWIAHLGGMSFTLALSGWTENDWTSGSNLDLLFGSYESDVSLSEVLLRYLEKEQRASLATLLSQVNDSSEASRRRVLGSLNLLAKQGQVVYDFSSGVYRHRQVLPIALSESLIGPENPELTQGRKAYQEGTYSLHRREPNHGKSLFFGEVSGVPCEALLDADFVFYGAQCACSVFAKNRLRAGPCRHLLALRFFAQQAQSFSLGS
jgi:hypothetical protein